MFSYVCVQMRSSVSFIIIWRDIFSDLSNNEGTAKVSYDNAQLNLVISLPSSFIHHECFINLILVDSPQSQIRIPNSTFHDWNFIRLHWNFVKMFSRELRTVRSCSIFMLNNWYAISQSFLSFWIYIEILTAFSVVIIMHVPITLNRWPFGEILIYPHEWTRYCNVTHSKLYLISLSPIKIS